MFSIGDTVELLPEFDTTLKTTGDRTPPGTVIRTQNTGTEIRDGKTVPIVLLEVILDGRDYAVTHVAEHFRAV